MGLNTSSCPHKRKQKMRILPNITQEITIKPVFGKIWAGMIGIVPGEKIV